MRYQTRYYTILSVIYHYPKGELDIVYHLCYTQVKYGGIIYLYRPLVLSDGPVV